MDKTEILPALLVKDQLDYTDRIVMKCLEDIPSINQMILLVDTLYSINEDILQHFPQNGWAKNGVYKNIFLYVILITESNIKLLKETEQYYGKMVCGYAVHNPGYHLRLDHAKKEYANIMKELDTKMERFRDDNAP